MGHEVLLVASDANRELASKPRVTWFQTSVDHWPTRLLKDQAFAWRSTQWLHPNHSEVDVTLANPDRPIVQNWGCPRTSRLLSSSAKFGHRAKTSRQFSKRLPMFLTAPRRGRQTGFRSVPTHGRLNVSDHVHFLGYRRDIPDLMRTANIFVFPSRYEACPLVLLEAMASGLPIVTAQTAGGSRTCRG
jgi:hypothetical protein